jgi:asparagine synthase (glutamine-hydrolysing)
LCGIAGKIDFGGGVDAFVIERMCAAMRHRGPDARGVWCEGSAGLGIQRLAIIDVTGGDQPIFNGDRSVAVVMNGEIYNFRGLRSELQAKGHVFASGSDTEVLVHLYEESGDDLVDRLRGMFAFAIWDARRQRLLLARDRIGKKPLFVARRGAKVWFASEVLGLLQDPEIDRVPDPKAIASYLAFQWVPHPLSAFAGVEKLPPASTMSISADKTDVRRFWALDFGSPRDNVGREELEEELRALIWEATRARLISEVPLGAFLSGGIDSSAVVAAMASQMSEPVKTFSIGFPDADYDELRYARLVSERFGTDHHEFVVEPRAIEIMPRLARHYGEPFADPSAVPSFYLAELTSDHVTVALNGDGGDENFAGYPRYKVNSAAAHLDRVPLFARSLICDAARHLGDGGRSNSARGRLRRLAQVLPMPPPARYAHYMSAFPLAARHEMFEPEFLAATENGWEPDDIVLDVWQRSGAASVLHRMLDTDVNVLLPDGLLVKMDIATMAHSVEARSPFLDHRLMEFAASLPPRFKLRGGADKVLLKSALRGILPDEILDRSKMGFAMPLNRWLREDLRELPQAILLSSDSRVHAYVKPEAVRRLIQEHNEASADHSLRLWVLLQLEMWHREVVESPLIDISTSTITSEPANA